MTSSMLEAIALLILASAAHWRGGIPERMIAWLMVLSYLVDEVYHLAAGASTYQYVDPGHLVIDSAVLAGLLWVSLRANRFWPLPVCSLELIAVTAHFAVLAGVPGIRGVYWAMTVVPSWLQYPVILIGILAHSRRFIRVGRYRDWRCGLNAFGGHLVFDQRQAAG
jgi:hypothetical protein